MWFRSDLRIDDNPALSNAMQDGATAAVYFLTPEQWCKHDFSPARLSLMARQLDDLTEQLASLNVPIIIRKCADFSAVPAAMAELIVELGASKLYFNHEYEVNEMAMSRNVVKKVRQLTLQTVACHDQCMIEPGKIKTAQGECYKVYSAFKRAYIKAFDQYCRDYYPCPQPQSEIMLHSDKQALDIWLAELERDLVDWRSVWPAGRDAVQNQLNEFLQQAVSDYHEYRDIPSINGTSGLSAYIAVGAISVLECFRAARQLNHGEIDTGQQGPVSWINELIWRDFYRHLLIAFPDLCRHKPFKLDTDKLPWKKDRQLFERWCQGKTGYPLVDAAMRQLLQTGWMHNRLRMVTAMFLTKHLFIDWRWGERFFMQHLVDGDFASNNGGWQWSASTGVDAVPYFRIFNPTRQSERFDEDGSFIRRYVPELAHLSAKNIHQPSKEQAIQAGYPLPVVEHKVAVAQTKSWFADLTQQVS
ncbi:deoxyribodipyrimidine photo-lyase [Neptunicella marina]|uniref:Deoxyribodipyrimidine photo-lyase n=2 Tax=Neptunicella marina TaxID=2125989 RepID=A0A8J6IN67_9ALTE|nr:deoxyribodipyrimidine photo-lyase [Neptunicella marina]